VLTSTNGVDWVKHVPNRALDSVTFAHGLFVAIGLGGAIFSSPDGVSWSQRTSPTTLALNGVTYCDDTYFIAGAGGMILQSAFSGDPSLSGQLDTIHDVRRSWLSPPTTSNGKSANGGTI
jgi:photosystem II stability/assembly factor-like uncharacterized protein